VPQRKTIHLIPDVYIGSCMEEHHLPKSCWAYPHTHTHTTHVTIGAFQPTPSASYNRAEYTTDRHVTNLSFTDMDSNLVL